MDLAELPEPEAADCLPLRDWLLERLPDLLSDSLSESEPEAEDFSSVYLKKTIISLKFEWKSKNINSNLQNQSH